MSEIFKKEKKEKRGENPRESTKVQSVMQYGPTQRNAMQVYDRKKERKKKEEGEIYSERKRTGTNHSIRLNSHEANPHPVAQHESRQAGEAEGGTP